MNRTPVTSSNVASIGFDDSSLTLEVEFNDGSVYQYFDVPEALYQEFMNASSKGKFLHDNIRHSFRYSRL